jgi:hypothetical protein
MRTVLKLLGFVALALTIVPALLVVTGALPLDTNRTLMSTGAVLWLASALLRDRLRNQTQVAAKPDPG